MTGLRCLAYNAAMGTARKTTLSVGVTVRRGVKAQRDKLSGVLRYAAGKAQWNVVILDQPTTSAVPLNAQIALAGRIDGESQDKGMPTVAVDNFSAKGPQTPSVFIDNREIGRTAADRFIRRGLANLATVRYTVGVDALHSAQRIEGFSAAAAKAGMHVSVYTPASETESQFLCDSEAFRKWLLDLPKPCGIFGYYDRQARDILDSCRLARISIPDHIFILGVDNETDVCEVTRPTLSSIQPDFEAAGYQAAKVLDQMLSHRKVKSNYSYGILQVVERESIRSMNAGGRIVSAAMKLIQADGKPPTVAGLSRRLNVSTALLNLRFNEILGHGPKEEIDRQRLAKVKSLLRDPSVSVAEISALCHFTFPEELHHFFRRRTGLTPTQWRTRGETA